MRKSGLCGGWKKRRSEGAWTDASAVVAVWGLAYKENTHSTKNSPSLVLIGKLPHARKQAYDPAVLLP